MSVEASISAVHPPAAQPPPAHPNISGLSWIVVWCLLLSLAVAATALVAHFRAGPPTGIFVPALAFLVCIVATAFDAATGHIPNQLTYPAVGIGLAINQLAPWAAVRLYPWLGAVAPSASLIGLAMCFAIGFGCVIFANMGGGDAKLLIALGTLMGFAQVASLMWWILLVALGYSLINLIVSGRLNGVLHAVAASVLSFVYLRRFESPQAMSRTRIPLAVPTLVALVFARLFPDFWM